MISFDEVEPDERLGHKRRQFLTAITDTQDAFCSPWTIVDLSLFNDLESSCLGFLLLLRQEVENQRGQFGLIGVNQRMKKILKISGMHAVINVYESLDLVPNKNLQ